MKKDSEGREIPQHKLYYVTTTDKFMSGWGPAERKPNKLIFPCDSEEEAEVVLANAQARGDQYRPRIRSRVPTWSKQQSYVQLKTKDDYPNWYKPGYFSDPPAEPPAAGTTYTDLWVLQGDYGYGDGWEDLCAEESHEEAQERYREYRDNEGGTYRIVKRREPNEPAGGRVQGRGTVTQPG